MFVTWCTQKVSHKQWYTEYVAKKEIPDIWKHCLLNDLGIFSEEENKKVVGIIGAFVRYRSLPEVNV